MTGYKKPPRRRTPEFQLQQCNANLTPLADKYRAGMSWSAIGAEIGVSGPVVFRAVVKGQIPKSRAMRRKLGMIRKRTGPTRQQMRWLQILGMLWGGEGPPPRKGK